MPPLEVVVSFQKCVDAYVTLLFSLTVLNAFACSCFLIVDQTVRLVFHICVVFMLLSFVFVVLLFFVLSHVYEMQCSIVFDLPLWCN